MGIDGGVIELCFGDCGFVVGYGIGDCVMFEYVDCVGEIVIGIGIVVVLGL